MKCFANLLCFDRFCMYKNISDSMLYLNNKKHEQIKYLKYALMCNCVNKYVGCGYLRWSIEKVSEKWNFLKQFMRNNFNI